MANKKNQNYERADYGGVGRDNLVSITIKVPRELREHWQTRARQRNQSLSYIVTHALRKTLGEPADESSAG